MSEKRFIVESVSIIDDCNEDKSRIVKVITDKEELYSYDDLYEISDLLNELNDKNEELNEQVNNYHATFQSLLKTNLSLNNQLAETQKQLNELYKTLFPERDEEHLNCRCSYEPNDR